MLINQHLFQKTSTISHHQQSLEEDRLRNLEQAFQDAASQIINDPLMQIFKEKEETQSFMFERMQEIIDEGIREANDKYVKEVVVKMDEMNRYNYKMKDEVESLRRTNYELQKLYEEAKTSRNYDSNDSVMVEKNKQLKINHEMITVLRSENEKLEARIGKMESEIQNKQDSDMDHYHQIEELHNKVNELMIENQSLSEMLDEAKENTEETNIDPLLSKIQNLERKLEVQTNAILGMNDKCKKLEKDKIKLNFEIEENRQEHERKVEELEQHNCILSSTNDEIRKKLQDTSKTVLINPLTKELQDEVQVLKSKVVVSESKLEDCQFFNEQLQQTSETLKNEIKDLTAKLSEERKLKHDLEIEVIEVKDINSELTLNNSNLNEELTSLRTEVRLSHLLFPNYLDIICQKSSL